MIASKYNPEKTIIKEEQTLEQSHMTQNMTGNVNKSQDAKVKFETEFVYKESTAANDADYTLNDYTLAEYTVIGGVKKKKKKKIKRKVP